MSEPVERDRWARVQVLFEWVLDLPPDERAARLAAEEDDAAVRAEVLSLLEHHHTEGRLDAVAEELAALTGRDSGGRSPERAAGGRRARRGRRASGAPSAEAPSSGDGLPGADLAESVADAPARVGPYRVVRTLARGGMGWIHLAEREDAGDHRLVAVKLLRADIETEALRRRFLAEQQIVARIAHPNIAAFLDDGVTPEGLPYFVMEYVEGEPIDEHCDRHRLGVPERLELVLVVCDAVEHAHRHRLVHRDLKADNILVTPSGTVKLLDFGIAKALEPGLFPAADHHTTKGVRLLTPEYASPEQLAGWPITPASDVYQLGLLLYELLTGALPSVLSRIPSELPGYSAVAGTVEPPSELFRTRREWLPWVRGARRRTGEGTAADLERPALDPERAAGARGTTPRELARLLSGELDDIVMNALRERPEERHASVAALRQDLRRYLERHPDERRPERAGTP